MSLKQFSPGIALDSKNNVFITGITNSSDFPISSMAFDKSYNGGEDMYIAKFDSGLKKLLATTFLGGDGKEEYPTIALDGKGDVYVGGTTGSSNFPTTSGSYDPTFNGSHEKDVLNKDIFISKFDGNLKTLLASTFFGTEGYDVCFVITLDKEGNVYVGGHSGSSVPLPVTPGAYDTTYNGYNDGYVSKFSSDLSTLKASTFLSGEGRGLTMCEVLTSDEHGNIYVSGNTGSSSFPTTSGAYDTSHNGGPEDIFIMIFKNDLKTLMASTLVGGNAGDFGKSFAIDRKGNVYVAGFTASSDFPITPSAYDKHCDKGDIFIIKLDNALSKDVVK